MNLVQIQERLKDAPVQAIMQYANGTNPMVPPYLALAELKRRESINQSAQAQQAMQQGQPPSVKDQIEQAAGLAALQQQMQQQGMQNLMAQARPQGIPENVPQPRRQPESEGISGLPAGDFNFADGGIVAFQDGGPTTPIGRVASGIAEKIGGIGSGIAAGYQESEEKQRLIEAIREELSPRTGISGAFAPQTNEQYARARQLERSATPMASAESLKNILAEAKQLKQAALAPSVGATRAAQDTGYAAKEAARAAAVKTPEGAEMMRGKPAPVSAEPPKFELAGDYESAMQDIMAIRDPAERMAAMEALQRTQRTGPAQQQPASTGAAPARGIAALPGADEAMQMTLGQMRAKRSLEDIAAEQEKAKGIFGMTQPYGEERMKRAQAMEAARQQELESRGMERLMRVMGGIGARGLGGAGTAYLQSIEQERAADAAFRKQMDELLGGVEEKRRAEAVTGMTEAQRQKQEEAKSAQEAAGKIMDMDTRFKLQELQAKAVAGRLSAEEQYIMSEINKGRSYPDIVAKIAEAKAGPRSETAEQQRFKDTYLKVARAYDDLMVKPEGISRDEYIRREVDRAMGATPIGGTSGTAIPQQAIDRLKQNPQLRAQFDEWYGAGASAKYLGK